MERSIPEHEQPHPGNSTGAAIRAILESSIVGFVALDRELRFLYVNSRAEELLQKPRAELLGKNAGDEFPDDVTAPFYAGYHNAFHMGTPTRFEAFFAPRNAWLEVHVYPSDIGLSVYFHEVTGQRQVADAWRGKGRLPRAVGRP